MPTNLITQCNPASGVSGGVTYTWYSDFSCNCYGTTTGTLSVSNIIVPAAAAISTTPFRAGRKYQLIFSAQRMRVQAYFYPQTTGGYDSSFNVTGDHEFTIPDPCARMTLRLRAFGNTTINEVVAPEIYDITFTDRDADIQIMADLIQHGPYPNSWFLPIWNEFAAYLGWDGESCSEIACCVSYMAGNLSKIFVSNYADGLYQQYLAAGRYHTPAQGAQIGDFMWWDYDFDGVPDHTGRVYDILSDGTIITFEGNVGGMTTSRPYSPNDPTIFGYGRPNYDYDPALDPDQPGVRFQPHNFFRHTRRLRGNLL